MTHETKEGHEIGIADMCAVYGCAGCQACKPVRDSTVDSLRAEVERLRVDLRAARDAIEPLDALAAARWVEINKMTEEGRKRDAEVERLREALRTACDRLSNYDDPADLRAALSSAPPAKPSALDEALAAWRGLPAGSREALLTSMQNDRERLDEQSSNYVLPEDVAHRNAVLLCCDVTMALLRAAGVKP